MNVSLNCPIQSSTSLFPPKTAVEVPEKFLHLWELTNKQWAERSTDILNAKIDRYCLQFTPVGKTEQMIGFIVKRLLSPGSNIAVIGDIHGDDLKFVLTLKSLLPDFFDEQGHLKPDKYIILLGDYVDRGVNSLKILEMVMTIKMENPDQVFVIRGNHEDLNTSKNKLIEYTKNDPKYLDYKKSAINLDQLNRFYECLPVMVFIGQKTDSGVQEYMQFSHAFANLYTDPYPLFVSNDEHLWIKKDENKFSLRIVTSYAIISLKQSNGEEISKREKKWFNAVIQTKNTISKMQPDVPKFSNVYWTDFGKTVSLKKGRPSIPIIAVKSYLKMISSDTIKVKRAMRGHQGLGIWNITDAKNKVVATTIDASFLKNEQLYLRLELREKVRDWQIETIKIPLAWDHTVALSGMRKFPGNEIPTLLTDAREKKSEEASELSQIGKD